MILIPLECVHLQLVEPALGAVDERASLGDLLEQQRIRPIDQHEIDLAIGVQRLQIGHELRLAREGVRHPLDEHCEVDVAVGPEMTGDRRPELNDQLNAVAAGDRFEARGIHAAIIRSLRRTPRCHVRYVAAACARLLTMVASGSYHAWMRAVGLKLLKNKLSEYVRLASGGETVLITDRDRVVAELVPPATGRSRTVDDVSLADLVRHGWLTPPLIGPGVPDVPRRPACRFTTLLEELDRDRADR